MFMYIFSKPHYEPLFTNFISKIQGYSTYTATKKWLLFHILHYNGSLRISDVIHEDGPYVNLHCLKVIKNIIRCLTHVIISYIKPYTIFLLYRNECFANKHNYRLNNRKYWLGMWLWDLVKRVLLRLQRIWPWYAVLSLIFSIISLLFLIFIPRREIWRKKLEFILITFKVRMVTKKWNCRFGR